MTIIAQIDQDAWNDWVSTRPPEVQAICRSHPPDRLYRMNSTGHRVLIIAYGEDGTVRVRVSGKYNFLAFEREVFGVDARELIECALPGLEDPVGVVCETEEAIQACMDHRRGTNEPPTHHPREAQVKA